MPTVIPAELGTMFDNQLLLLGSIGVVTLVAIYSITAWKYARGLS